MMAFAEMLYTPSYPKSDNFFFNFQESGADGLSGYIRLKKDTGFECVKLPTAFGSDQEGI